MYVRFLCYVVYLFIFIFVVFGDIVLYPRARKDSYLIYSPLFYDDHMVLI